MRYHLNIRRGEGSGASRWQRFASPCAAEDSVARALEELDQRELLQDETGAEAERVAWDCACLEKKCGACAMVVSGRPALACAVSLGAAADSSGEITLEPLRKFPRIRDLQVDRGACFCCAAGNGAVAGRRGGSDQPGAAGAALPGGRLPDVRIVP